MSAQAQEGQSSSSELFILICDATASHWADCKQGWARQVAKRKQAIQASGATTGMLTPPPSFGEFVAAVQILCNSYALCNRFNRILLMAYNEDEWLVWHVFARIFCGSLAWKRTANDSLAVNECETGTFLPSICIELDALA